METIWMDGNEDNQLNQVGFIIQRLNTNNGGRDLRLSTVPAHTNQSHQPRLYGWCGETDNISTHACGIGKITRIAPNGRIKVQILDNDEAQQALEHLGYPDLD